MSVELHGDWVGGCGVAGNVIGGQKTKRTLYRLYGKDFYSHIGHEGGSVLGVKKGFAAMPKEKVRAAGKLGGTRSDRTGVKTGMGKTKRRKNYTLKKTPPSLYSKWQDFFGLIVSGRKTDS